MTLDDRAWGDAQGVLEGAGEVALLCHVDPDGDALGSMLACASFLRSRGARTVASFASTEGADGDGRLVVPPQYTFLPGLGDLVPPSAFPAAPDVLVVLDCGSPSRLGALRGSADRAGTVVVLDHHAACTAFGDVRLVDGDAAATAVLVEELVHRMGGQLDRAMATCLYVALVTDTGRFSHACTTPRVMDFAARLLGHGIDAAGINRQVWDTHSWGYLKVLGRALERARFEADAGLAWTVVRQGDLDECGIVAAETESFIDVLRGFDAAACTMVCKELPAAPALDRPAGPDLPRRWKVSLRSRGVVDVGRVCQQLGGGGHVFAAGFTAQGAVEDVVAEVRDQLCCGAPDAPAPPAPAWTAGPVPVPAA